MTVGSQVKTHSSRGARTNSAFAALEKARSNYMHTVRQNARISFKDVFRDLLELRRNHEFSDDQFAELMELVLASYIENEVNEKVERTLLSKLSANSIMMGLSVR